MQIKIEYQTMPQELGVSWQHLRQSILKNAEKLPYLIQDTDENTLRKIIAAAATMLHYKRTKAGNGARK